MIMIVVNLRFFIEFVNKDLGAKQKKIIKLIAWQNNNNNNNNNYYCYYYYIFPLKIL